MARWGYCDFQQLEQFNKKLEKLMRVDFDAFCRKMSKEIAARLLRRVKKRTPVGVVPEYATDEAKQKYWSGYKGKTLRDAWTVLPVEKHGDQYIVTVINNTEYASYVEYGHRQMPGRYVPVLGKSLKASWVPGRYMLTISTQELEQQAPKILEKKLYLFLKESLNAE